MKPYIIKVRHKQPYNHIINKFIYDQETQTLLKLECAYARNNKFFLDYIERVGIIKFMDILDSYIYTKPRLLTQSELFLELL